MQVEIITGLFGFILTVLGTLLVSYFKDMKNDVKNMSESVFQLNIKLEKVISDQSYHKEEIQDIKKRLKDLEN